VEEGCEALVYMTWDAVRENRMLAHYFSGIRVLSKYVVDGTFEGQKSIASSSWISVGTKDLQVEPSSGLREVTC
jgi:hypothetical protein